MTPQAIALAGATATGKTTLAIAVARRLDGEIISFDSRQAYRGLEIGTAAPDSEERAAVPHHGVGFLEPTERYSAGRFARLAREWIAGIRDRDRTPVLAGGTGFFLRALLEPVFREAPLDDERRGALRSWLATLDTERLRAWASRLDPELPRRLGELDRQRAARSLELSLLTGRSLCWWQRHSQPEAPAIPMLVYALALPAELHRARIAERTRTLVEGGWLDEVRALEAAGVTDAPSFNAVGYGEMLALSHGELSQAEALARINRATWAYARRQRTWFRHQLPADAMRLDASEDVGQLAQRIAGDWRRCQDERAGRQRG